SVWQQAHLNDEILRGHKSYWLKQFEGTLPVLNLTGNKDRPAIKTYNGAITDKIITADLSRRFKFFCKQQGGTLFQGLLAAVNALLYKYTDQKDIIIGSPTAGRELTDLENQIGLYVNTLAFRTRFKGEDSFYELFEVVKQTALDAYEHQTYPFDALVSSLNIQRDVSRNVLFDVWMVLHNTEVSYNAEEQNTEKLKIGRYAEAGKVISKFDLLFHFREMGDELGVSIEYNTDILSKRKADELGEQFEAILTYVTKHPEMLLCKMTNRLTEMEEETKNEHLRKIRVKNLVKLKNKGI
ncbi:MAG: condensation domain-containing protein, partial [Bacteroidota bacterium]